MLAFNPQWHPPKDLSDARLYVPAKNVWSPEIFEGNRKPDFPLEVNWENHFAKNLTHAFFFEGGETFEYVNGRRYQNTNPGTFSADGYHQTGTEELQYPPYDFDPTHGCLAMDFLSNGSAPAGFAKMFTTGDDEFVLHRKNSDTLMSIRINSVDTGVDHTIADLWDQSPHTITAIWNINTNARNMRVDGATTTTSTAFTDPGASPNVGIMNRTDGQRECEGRVKYCLVWRVRGLSNSESDEIHANPLQVLKPKGPPMVNVKKADILQIPERRFEYPTLLEPNKQPDADQIEIDWSLPITKGMDGIYVFKNQTANHDLSGKQEPLILGSATFSSTNKGIAINLDDGEYATIANFTPTTNNTWAYWLKAIAHDSANSRIFGMENAYEARFAFDSPTWNITNEFGVETVTVQEGWTDSVQVEDVWYFVVQVTDAGGRDILFTCLNGVVDSNDTGGGHIDLDPGATYSTGTMTIGNRTGAVDTDAFQGQMGGLFYHWNRALTIPEALHLSRHNYHFFIPK